MSPLETRAPWSDWGLSVARVARPGGPQELAEILAECAARGEKVLPVGAARSLAAAGAPAPCDVALSFEGLDGVVEYSPGDMTITVLGGTKLETIQRMVEARGQRLPGLPKGDGTIGGLLATGWNLPEARESQGALRERLLGVQIADPSGRLTRSGGRVVKNVTGYDLHRMHVGAGGAFGVFTELTLRLEPLPEYRAEVRLEVPGWEGARQAWRWLRSDGPEAGFLGVRLMAPAGLEFVALLEGDDEPARRQVRDLVAGWQGFGRVQTREPKSGEVPPAQGPTRLSVALRAAPSMALEWFERVAADETLARLTTGSACYPQAGEICLELQGRAEDLTARVRAFAESAKGGGPAYRVLEEVPPFLPPDLPCWSADPGALRLLARLKRALDPGDILRPGSYSAGALERAAAYFAESR